MVKNNLEFFDKEYSLLNQFTVALSVLSLAVYTVALCRYNAGELFAYSFWKSIQIIPFIVLLLCTVTVNYIKKPRLCLSVSQFSNVIMMLFNLIFFGQMTYTNAYYETIRLLFYDSRYIKLSLIITFAFGLFALLAMIHGNQFWCRLYYSLNILFYAVMFMYMFFDDCKVESDIAMSVAYLLYNISNFVFSYNLKTHNNPSKSNTGRVVYAKE
ncbi:MAG: hypothetical protein J1E81_02545 [Eubacterium sp.]|nr:hypothetical protein [Eubacterium sp.]